MANANRRHTTRERINFNLGVNDHGVNVDYDAEQLRQATNCDLAAQQHARSQRANDKRKRVAQGATAGFFAGGLTGAGIGTGLGALIGSIVPGPGTLIGAAVGATIGGICGAGTVGGAGVAVGAGVAAVLPNDTRDRD